VASVKESLTKMHSLDGFVGACIVDSNSGMMLGAEGGGSMNLEVAAAGNTEVVRAKRKTMKALNIGDAIEDILITLGKQYHLIRPLPQNDALFVYLVLDRNKGNLAMARHHLAGITSDLVI
jgi:predicted regulator of Ras-like GTPase activity (Roadblock/LC7/MglB family)